MLGWLLASYAVVGALLAILSLAVGGPLMTRAEQLAGSATGSMQSAADAAEAAADAFDGFDASLDEAERSTAEAATISRDTAGTLRSLSDAMAISIFGNQPLLPLADEFARSADQLDQMGANLDAIGQALTTNQEDVASLAVELRSLADQLGKLRGAVDQEQAGSASAPPLRLLLFGFVAWQLLTVTAAGVGAWLVLRGAR